MKFSSAVLLTATAGSALSAAVSGYSNATSTVTDIQHTVVTITSCSDNKCTEIPQTTGLTTVTENDTIYTTYCPLTAEEATEKSSVAPESKSSAPAPAPESSAAPAKTTVAAESSAPAKTTVAESSAPAKTTVAAESTSEAASSAAPSVAPAANGANAVGVSAAAAGLIGAIALLY